MYSGVGNDDQHELLEEDEEEEDDDNDKRTILDQERFLPIANISRIMKKLLPTSGKVAKEAKECVQECVSEFISFLTSEACDRCRQEKRKTISAEDLMRSLMNMGFDEYIEPMESFLRRYREVNKIAHRPPMYQPGTGSYGNPALASNAVITQPIALTIPHSAPMVSTSSAPIQFATASHVQLATPQIQAAPRIAPQPGVQVYTMPAHEVIPAPTFAVVTSTSDVNSRPPEMLESVQLMMDPSTNQHYMVVENPDGTRELRAVQLVTGDMNSIPVGDMNPVPADPSPPIATSSFSQRNAPNPFKASTGPIRNATRAKSNTMPYQKK